MNLLTERISPGVDPAAEVKAAFLADIITGTKNSPLIDKIKAVLLFIMAVPSCYFYPL